MRTEAARRAMESWEAARQLRETAAPACHWCRWYREGFMDDLRSDRKCIHPVVSPVTYDAIEGKFTNSSQTVGKARGEAGLCGPIGKVWQWGWLGWWWKLGGLGRLMVTFLVAVPALFFLGFLLGAALL